MGKITEKIIGTFMMLGLFGGFLVIIACVIGLIYFFVLLCIKYPVILIFVGVIIIWALIALFGKPKSKQAVEPEEEEISYDPRDWQTW